MSNTDLYNSKFREVKLITVKRLHMQLKEQVSQSIEYGHWWIEIGDPYDVNSESYGWWPKEPVGFIETFTGVEGELNATSRIRTPFRDSTGLAIRDPHHADSADDMFHPMIPANDSRTDDEIAECIRSNAKAYNGKWQWFIEAGQNCHTFQLSLLKKCFLLEPEEYRSRILPIKYKS